MKKLAAAVFVILAVVLGSLSFAGAASATESCAAQTEKSSSTGTDCPSEGVSESASPTPDEPSESPTVYPPTETPSNDVSPPQDTSVNSNDVQSNDVSDESAALPNTGGPDGLLLGGAVALLVAGGAAVVVARRRQTD
jgi:LPXTG-motif cell wall-anchored protein